ncbi:MAG: sensory box histidine kinase/response regulator [Myxococcaceae bacterium]|nr:sensory box histidine kinase/response regulator [Myxococcaceae bacterium]
MSDGPGWGLTAMSSRSNEAPRDAAGTSALVALIEDDDDIREALESLLNHAGYRVLPYASAEVALRDMEGGRHPDLILLDLMMPGMNGWQFRVEQRKRPALTDIPVIALSADVSPYAAAIDADAYLRKPVDFDRLCTVIEQIILASERKRLASKAVELERIRALGLLVAGVAHEINNPLTYVLGNLELASSRQRSLLASPERAAALGPKLFENIEAARDGAERIAFIVRLLSTFVRGSGDEIQSIDVLRALDAAARLAMQHIRTRARLKLEVGPLPPVRANEARLAQVFLNLLINAAQAIPEGSPDLNEIRVTANQVGAKVVIVISDTGCGIAPELTARIFEPFYTTKPADQGTGLGLSIARDVILAFGGSITVDSELGRGAAFKIELPTAVKEEIAPESTNPTRSMPVSIADQQRILVLDDEPLIGEFLAGALDAHQVDLTTDGHQAITRAEDGSYDLVLCDLRMPRMSGIEFYRELKRKRPDLASCFVLMTGAAIDEELQAFLSSNAVPVLRKPFDMNELNHCVARSARAKAGRPRRAS